MNNAVFTFGFLKMMDKRDVKHKCTALIVPFGNIKIEKWNGSFFRVRRIPF